jgi:hypothetical protein
MEKESINKPSLHLLINQPIELLFHYKTLFPKMSLKDKCKTLNKLIKDLMEK